jgi:glycerol uptake facilitator-like aquaporin
MVAGHRLRHALRGSFSVFLMNSMPDRTYPWRLLLSEMIGTALLLLIGLGLLAITSFYTIAQSIAGQEKAIHALLSLGFGGSLISVFGSGGRRHLHQGR